MVMVMIVYVHVFIRYCRGKVTDNPLFVEPKALEEMNTDEPQLDTTAAAAASPPTPTASVTTDGTIV